MKTTIKTQLIILLTAFSSFVSAAQSIDQEKPNEKHIISIGLPGLLFRNFNLGYEYVINENSSIALKAGFLIPRTYDASLFTDFGDGTQINAENAFTDIMGNSQVLEYRFYVGKKGAPKGFYFAPMIRRYYFNIGTSAIYDNTNFNIDMNIKSTGLGLQLGAQFDISDNLSLDWYFLGSSVGSNQVEIEITSSDPTIDWEEVRDEIEADSPSWPTGTSTSIEAGDDFFRFTGKTIGVGIRTGLTLGYRF